MALTKTQTFQMKRLKRSAVSLAPYNPRTIDRHAQKLLSENLSREGLVMPLVVNLTTGNLVAGHQRLKDIDAKEGYPKKTADYEMDYAVIQVTEKREKELNLFLNNSASQGSVRFGFIGQAILRPAA